MPSLIPGFEYDIFISYRQKDNKGEKWVSKFVDCLQNELESTLKESVRIYFDNNRHDGILETHDVDSTLTSKLKCLIFIPVISRTYCDPKSFAWENEFKVFVSQAKVDALGLKIKLANGNVASRVLPVIIHELDDEDKKLCESVTGGYLRGVEFIYKAPGINRPLRQSEELPMENIHRTSYRDQVNKTANSINDLIKGIQKAASQYIDPFISAEFIETSGSQEVHPGKKPWHSRLKTLAILFVFIGLGGLAIINRSDLRNRFGGRSEVKDIKKYSIAVMPFSNLTNDTLFDIWQPGLQNLMIAGFSSSDEFSVRQTDILDQSLSGAGYVSAASLTPRKASSVARKLDANILIMGSLLKASTELRVSVHLINPATGQVLISFESKGFSEYEFFGIVDSLLLEMKAFLRTENLESTYKGYGIKEIYTASPEALKFYLQGRSLHGKLKYDMAADAYLSALGFDSTFVSPMLMLSYLYGDAFDTRKCRMWADKAYRFIDRMPEGIKLQIKEVKAASEKRPEDQKKYLEEYLLINPYSTLKLYTLGWVNYNIGNWKEAIIALEKGISLNRRTGGNYRLWIWHYVTLGNSWSKEGNYRKSLKYLEDGLRLWPDEVALVRQYEAVSAFSYGREKAAVKFLNDGERYLRNKGTPESAVMLWLAELYSKAAMPTQAETYYRRALDNDQGNPYLMNSLGNHLIEYGINVDEGMALVSGALEKVPGDVFMLESKGWGLYRQGRFKESLKQLESTWEMLPVYDRKLHDHLLSARMAAGV